MSVSPRGGIPVPVHIGHLLSPFDSPPRLFSFGQIPRKTRFTWHTVLRVPRVLLSSFPRTLAPLNLIQYNMSPSRSFGLSATSRGVDFREGGWLFKTVPISIQRETSSYYDRSNPDWSGQVFHSRGVPVRPAPVFGEERERKGERF